jgi:ubiquinone biosynthesis protein COQ4
MNAAFAAPTPVPSSFPGRVKNALAAMRGLNADPNRLDLVFVLGEAVNRRAFPRVWALFERDVDGRRVLADRPAIDSAHVDLGALAALPEGTLGREYARFIQGNGLTLDVFKAPVGVDEHVAYLVQRVRQTHDLWHVVTGYTPDVKGEVLLQAFTFAQLRVPSALFITLIGAVRVSARGGLGFVREAARAFRRGKATRQMVPFYWEEHWSDSVESVRAMLECPAA